MAFVPTPTSEIEGAVRAALVEKNQGVDWYLIKDKWPRLYYTHPCFLSHVSWTAVAGDWRYVDPSQYVQYMGIHATPGMIAREYLNLKYKLPLRARGVQIEDARNIRSAPLLSNRGAHGYCFYLDLKAAYWNIMNIGGWDVDYRPQKYLGLGVSPRDFPAPKIKTARNALASVGVSSDLQLWTGFKVETLKVGNRYKNRILTAFILDVLNSIAYDMALIGAVYVNTDGYIVKLADYENAASVLNAWGLPWSVKSQGETTVYGVGSYEVGEVKTKHLWASGHDFAKIDGEHADFLRPRMKWAIARRISHPDEL